MINSDNTSTFVFCNENSYLSTHTKIYKHFKDDVTVTIHITRHIDQDISVNLSIRGVNFHINERAPFLLDIWENQLLENNITFEEVKTYIQQSLSSCLNFYPYITIRVSRRNIEKPILINSVICENDSNLRGFFFPY